MTISDARAMTMAYLSELFDAGECQAIFRELASWIMGDGNEGIWNPEQKDQLIKALERLQTGEPLQYVTGRAWFYDIPFTVNRSVLIPRPETEELVHLMVADLKKATKPLRIADLGTGSGCIPITLKKHLPHAMIMGVDLSAEALSIAQENAQLFNQSVQWIAADMLDISSLEGLAPLDVIVSNPPYITLAEANSMAKQVKDFEPNMALFVTNNDPLQFYKAIALLGQRLLVAEGRIYLECHKDYVQDVCMLFQSMNYEADLKTDMSGNPRFVFAKLQA